MIGVITTKYLLRLVNESRLEWKQKMVIQSLGYQTQLMVDGFDSEIIDRGSYMVIVTPSTPGYYWGNFILFSDPPQIGDLANWSRIYAKEIGYRPHIEHQAFGWDSPDGDLGHIEPFERARFHIEQSTVFKAAKVRHPPEYDASIIVRTVAGESDWHQAIYRHWRGESAMWRYRAMSEAGHSAWFGAFVGDLLVGGLGICVKDGLGRFMSVGTHPDFQRRGVCRSLVYQAACYAFEHMGANTLVMGTTKDSQAARIYQQVGFEPVEQQVGVKFP
jgi:ribosomal protein S18 acetylase RimI-like enzyme